MSTTQLILVRHGNNFRPGETILRIGCRTDISLTEGGKKQGYNVGQYLKAHGILPARIVCAPLLRTRQTAEEIRAGLDSDVEISTEEFLTELDYGMDDGKPEEEVILRLGKAEQKTPISEATPEEVWITAGKAALERWNRESILPEGWKHLQASVEMLRPAWISFANRVATEYVGQTVVAVTSNGIARFAQSILPTNAKMSSDNFSLRTGALGIFTHDSAGWRCTAWNLRPNEESLP